MGKKTRLVRCRVIFVAFGVIAAILPTGVASATPTDTPLLLREVQVIEASDLEVARPTVITYDPVENEFGVTGERAGSRATVEFNSRWDAIGVSSSVPDPSALTPRSESGELIAVNPEDGLTYAYDATTGTLTAMSGSTILSVYDAAGLPISSPESMTFAPSSDSTDAADAHNLFIADSGGPADAGGVVELTLEQATFQAATATATLVQHISTDWNPPAADPSGVTWNPNTQQLLVVDSEINEHSLWDDVNIWRINQSGVVQSTGATFGPLSAGSYSDEPTGVGYDASTNTMFITDDTGTRMLNVVDAGPDGIVGNGDDDATSIPVPPDDPEDPEWHVIDDVVYFLGGTDRELYRLDPVDGVFGNGNDNLTSSDIAWLGPTDFEGLTHAPNRGTLYIAGRSDELIFEVTTSAWPAMELVRTIDATNIPGLGAIGGMGMAPSSTDPSVPSLWVTDRGSDEVNDGDLFELAVPALDDSDGNEAPVANDDSATTDEDTVVDIDVLANDTDGDGDGLSIVNVSDPGSGSAVVVGGQVRYSPDADFEGTDTFTYQASDGVATSNTATVTVTVTGVNDAPVAVDDAAATSEDTAVDVDVLANDSDVDDVSLSIVNVSDPGAGSAVVVGGQVRYTPDPGVFGVDTFTYQASDGVATSNTATVTVTVTETNEAPVANDDSATTDEDTVVDIDVLANDTDGDGDQLSIVNLSDPANGTAVVNGSNVGYTPDPGFSGIDTFTYEASDGTTTSNTATVTVTVVDDGSVDQFAQSQTTTFGSAGADLTLLQASDDASQELVEEHTGGPRRNRISRLDHQWAFQIVRGDVITFVLEARRPANSESDDFDFSYSTDGGATWAPLVTVAQATDTLHSIELPNTISGELLVRVVDTDRTAGNGTTHSLFVDRMVIVSENPQAPLPTVTIEATDDTANEADPSDTGTFTISRVGSDGDLVVGYTLGGTATDGVDYTAVPSGSVTILDGQTSATVAITPVDDGDSEGSESVVAVITPAPGYQVGFPSEASVELLDDDLIAADFDAVSQTTARGTVVAGALSSTHADDDLYLEVREEAYAGGKRTRLEHTFTFDVTAGSQMEVHLQAYRTPTEPFVVSWSTDGSSWTAFATTVDTTSPPNQYLVLPLPGGLSGNVYVRFTDADSSKFEPVLDSIYIDDLFIRSVP